MALDFFNAFTDFDSFYGFIGPNNYNWCKGFKGPFIYDGSHFGGRGQPNSDICWQGESVKVWHFADARWPEEPDTKLNFAWEKMVQIMK